MAKGEEHINNEGMVEACRADPEKPNYRGCPFDSNGGHLPSNASPEERAEFEAKAEKVAQDAAQQDSTVGSSKSKKVKVPSQNYSFSDMHDDRELAMDSFEDAYGDNDNEDEALSSGTISLYLSAAKRHGRDESDVFEDSNLENGMIKAGDYADDVYQQTMTENYHLPMDERRRKAASEAFEETAKLTDRAFRTKQDDHSKFFGDERLELEKRYHERRLENIRQEISNPNSPVYQEVQEMARRPDSHGEELGDALTRAVDRDRNFAEKLGMRRATSIHGGKHFVTDVRVTRDALAAEKRRLGVEDAKTQSNWVFSQHMYDKIATAPDFNDTVRNPDTTPEDFREISLREMERKRDLIQHQMWDIAKPAADNFNPDDVAWAHELEKRRKSLRGY